MFNSNRRDAMFCVPFYIQGQNQRTEMIELPSGVTLPEIPLDRMYAGTIRGLAERIRRLYDAIYSRFGEEGLALIRDVSAEYGKSIAENVKFRYGEMELPQLALFLTRIFNGMLGEGKITEWSEEKVTIMVKECPYPFTTPEICKAHTCMEKALAAELNPGIDYVIEKSVPCGDTECWHTLKIVSKCASVQVSK